MHKLYLLVSFLLFCLASFTQDTTWIITTVNKDMAFSLPSNQEKIDTSGEKSFKRMDFRVYKASTGNTLFVLTVTRKEAEINVTDPESLKETYTQIEMGLKQSKNLSGYKTVTADTTIDKIPARKIIFYTGNDSLNSSLKGYFFLLNDHLYLLLLYKQGADEVYNAESNRLLRSIHFTATKIGEQRFNSKLESRGYRFGYLIGEMMGALVILGVIILVIVLIVRKSSGNRNSNGMI